MKVILVGLGKMGMQIAKRFKENNYEVIALDNNNSAKSEAIKSGIIIVDNREEALAKVNNDQVVLWLMIPASAVDNELNEWLKLLPAKSIIVDGGNSNFRNTINRAKRADANNIYLLDVGTSGGVLGTVNGFSMMVGGDQSAYNTITPLLDALAKPKGGHHYFGPSGTGHYIKMVHNAIEYGIMESLAEGYRVLKEGPIKNINLGEVGDIWQKASIISSDLNGLVAQIMHENPDLKGIDGFVAESGEARWTLEVAKENNIHLPAINESFNIRLESQQGSVNFATKTLAALRNKFGGHNINKTS